MSTPTITSQLPTGVWTVDALHSSATFAVKHMVVATFRGAFEDFDATLTVDDAGAGSLVGTVRADSISIKDDALKGHLAAPDFFDSARYPELRFATTTIRREGDELIVDGDLTIKDQTHPVEARGTISDPHVTFGDVEKIGLTLETIIDRTKFGLSWNAPLPKGGFALANDVKLTVELELARSEEA